MKCVLALVFISAPTLVSDETAPQLAPRDAY